MFESKDECYRYWSKIDPVNVVAILISSSGETEKEIK